MFALTTETKVNEVIKMNNSEIMLPESEAIENSFMKGWLQVPQGIASDVRESIKAKLHILTNVGFYKRLKGQVNHIPSERAVIESEFAKIGILNPWGNEYNNKPDGEATGSC